MRVVDPSHIPSVPPSELTRKILGDLGDYLTTDALAAVDAVRDLVLALISEAYNGRTEGVIAVATDIREAMVAFVDHVSFTTLATNTIALLDHEHARGLAEAHREAQVRAIAMTMRGIPSEVLRAHRELHERQCRQARCIHHEALERAERRARGGN